MGRIYSISDGRYANSRYQMRTENPKSQRMFPAHERGHSNTSVPTSSAGQSESACPGQPLASEDTVAVRDFLSGFWKSQRTNRFFHLLKSMFFPTVDFKGSLSLLEMFLFFQGLSKWMVCSDGCFDSQEPHNPVPSI